MGLFKSDVAVDGKGRGCFGGVMVSCVMTDVKPRFCLDNLAVRVFCLVVAFSPTNYASVVNMPPF